MNGNSAWQRGVLNIDHVNDYMRGEYSYISYDGLAYFVAPCIDMVNNGYDSVNRYLFYIPNWGGGSKGRFVKIRDIDCFTPTFVEKDYHDVQ